MHILIYPRADLHGGFYCIASLRGYAAPLAWRCYCTAYGVGCGGAAGRKKVGVAVGVALRGGWPDGAAKT